MAVDGAEWVGRGLGWLRACVRCMCGVWCVWCGGLVDWWCEVGEWCV